MAAVSLLWSCVLAYIRRERGGGWLDARVAATALSWDGSASSVAYQRSSGQNRKAKKPKEKQHISKQKKRSSAQQTAAAPEHNAVAMALCNIIYQVSGARRAQSAAASDALIMGIGDGRYQ